MDPSRITIVSLEGLLPGTAANTHIEEIGAALRQRGYEVSILADFRHDYMSASIRNRLKRYVHLYRSIWRARTTTDLFYMRAHMALGPLSSLLKWRGSRIVVEVNGLTSDMATTYAWLRPFQFVLNLFERRLLTSADAAICVTAQIASITAAKVDAPVHYIANGVNTSHFRRKELAREPFAVFFGSLTAWHGIETLLNAAVHPDWPTDLELWIAGNGAYRTMIETAARQTPHINYLGLVAPMDMPNLLNRASIGLSPVELPEGRGLLEVAPLKLLEMMACNLPVVATNIPGQAEMIRAGAGIGFPPGDSGAQARAVATLWHDEATRREMGTKARMIAEDYDWYNIVGRIDALAIKPVLGTSSKLNS